MADIINNIYKNIPKRTIDINVEKFKEKLRVANPFLKKKIVLIDPVNLQPIKFSNNIPSQGKYKFFNDLAKKKSSEVKNYPDLFKKETSKAKDYPDLFKKGKKSPKIKKYLKLLSKKPVYKECPQGKVLNIKTNRCVKIKNSKKECPQGKVLNIKTNRCVKIKQ